MNTVSLSLSVAVLACAAATPASAQEATLLPETSRDSVGVDTGLENGVIARATYAHRFASGGGLDPRLYAHATLPVAAPDLGDWGVDAAFRITPLAWHDFRLSILGGPLLRRTSTDAYSATGFGLDAVVLAGYESARWGLALEGGYDLLLSTYIAHGAAYRETFYADAKDGWYALSGGRAHAGLRGGVRFGAVEVAARAGLNTTPAFAAMTPPFYFTLGTSYAF